MSKDTPQKHSLDAIHQDARGQYVQSKHGSTSDGVSSAKPQVITGSQDSTVHRGRSVKDDTSTSLSKSR
jgi:hypothetical protein